MGQLEKYGLYVLCLVIFLILGVTIWGGGETPVTGKRTPQAPIVAPGAVAGADNAAGAVRSDSRGDPLGGKNLDAWFGPSPRGNDPKKADAKSADAAGTKPPPDQGNPAEPKPAPDESRPKYKVKAKDTLEGIAKEKLGNASLHVLISKLNPGVEPTKLRVGDELRLPSAAEIAQLTAAPPASSGARPEVAAKVASKVAGGTYRVKKGDTLEGIATSQLGSRARVGELRELNPTVEPTNLRIGMSIHLPK
ncbi:MAG: LysM peptidoglycan-binding domain-containing protein [Planctomycetota bacterium]